MEPNIILFMPHRFILKVRKFQLPNPKCFSTVVKNIWAEEGASGLKEQL